MNIPLADGVPLSEFSYDFVRKMCDAMGLSFFKYGPVARGFPEKVDALATLEQKLAEYRATGNTQFLVDVANYAMIEFMRPRRVGAFYRPLDGSSGRTWNNGHVGETANTPGQENVRLGGGRLATSGGFYRREGD